MIDIRGRKVRGRSYPWGTIDGKSGKSDISSVVVDT